MLDESSRTSVITSKLPEIRGQLLGDISAFYNREIGLCQQGVINDVRNLGKVIPFSTELLTLSEKFTRDEKSDLSPDAMKADSRLGLLLHVYKLRMDRMAKLQTTDDMKSPDYFLFQANKLAIAQALQIGLEQGRFQGLSEFLKIYPTLIGLAKQEIDTFFHHQNKVTMNYQIISPLQHRLADILVFDSLSNDLEGEKFGMSGTDRLETRIFSESGVSCIVMGKNINAETQVAYDTYLLFVRRKALEERIGLNMSK